MGQCKSCKFFMAKDEDQGVISFFPPMLNEGWCGEFKEKEQ